MKRMGKVAKGERKKKKEKKKERKEKRKKRKVFHCVLKFFMLMELEIKRS